MDFEYLKEGMVLFRIMDVGVVRRTIEKLYTSDYGVKFIVFVGDKEPRNWRGVYPHYNIEATTKE
jgi:hypothetical protein